MLITLKQIWNYKDSPAAVNSAWLFTDRLTRLFFGLFITALMARYLGPDGFGVFSYAIAFVSLFGALITFGADGIIIRDLVSKPEKTNEIISSGLALRIAGLLLSLTCICISLAFTEPSESNLYILIISISLIFQSLDIGDLWFQSETKSKYSVIARFLSFLAFSLIKITLIYLGYPLIYFVYATAAETATGSLFLLAIFIVKSRIRKLNFNFGYAWLLAKESIPYIISSVAIMLYMRIDQVMLNKMSGDYETGLYSAALKFSEIWYLIPTIIVSTMSPKLTKLFLNSRKSYFETLQSMTTVLTRIAIAISITITIFSEYIIQAFFGERYIAAADILVIHIWSSIFVFCGTAVSPWVFHERVSFMAIWPPILGATVNIILNYMLIPQYGAKGCAIATLIAYAISSWIANSFFAVSRPIFILQVKAIIGINLK